jgi:hypothetical protein
MIPLVMNNLIVYIHFKYVMPKYYRGDFDFELKLPGDTFSKYKFLT